MWSATSVVDASEALEAVIEATPEDRVDEATEAALLDDGGSCFTGCGRG